MSPASDKRLHSFPSTHVCILFLVTDPCAQPFSSSAKIYFITILWNKVLALCPHCCSGGPTLQRELLGRKTSFRMRGSTSELYIFLLKRPFSGSIWFSKDLLPLDENMHMALGWMHSASWIK